MKIYYKPIGPLTHPAIRAYEFERMDGVERMYKFYISFILTTSVLGFFLLIIFTAGKETKALGYAVNKKSKKESRRHESYDEMLLEDVKANPVIECREGRC